MALTSAAAVLAALIYAGWLQQTAASPTHMHRHYLRDYNASVLEELQLECRMNKRMDEHPHQPIGKDQFDCLCNNSRKELLVFQKFGKGYVLLPTSTTDVQSPGYTSGSDSVCQAEHKKLTIAGFSILHTICKPLERDGNCNEGAYLYRSQCDLPSECAHKPSYKCAPHRVMHKPTDDITVCWLGAGCHTERCGAEKPNTKHTPMGAASSVGR